MFFDSVLTETRRLSTEAPDRRYSAFKDYPVREYLETLFECSRLAYPGLPDRMSLRRLGRPIYPNMAQTFIGRVLFKFAGKSVPRLLGAVPKAYSMVSRVARARVTELTDQSAVVELRNVWDVPDAYEVGIFEGGFEVAGYLATIQVRSHSLCDCDFRLRWRPL